MGSKAGILLLLGLVITVLYSCRKDPSLEKVWNGGTPVQLKVPEWAITPMHFPHVPHDNPMTAEGVALGRKLFYEKALSNDFSMSCGSCHQQEFAFSDPRPFSIGTDGSIGRRNSMTVMNSAFDHHFFWDGRAHGLEQQAFLPVVDHAEMRNTWPVVVERLRNTRPYPDLFFNAFGTEQIDSMLVVKAIAQFERTLLSFDSRFDRFHYGGDSLALTPQEKRGFDLFMNEASCGGCHGPPFFTDFEFRNNGLDMVPADDGFGAVTGIRTDNGKFKTTSLRNIAVSGPYMHDSRFTTLEQVLDFYAEDVQTAAPTIDSHMQPWIFGDVQLSQQDRADIIAFLHTLTDQSFLSDPAFSDPN
jgi:cytochrome c peroxidase